MFSFSRRCQYIVLARTVTVLGVTWKVRLEVRVGVNVGGRLLGGWLPQKQSIMVEFKGRWYILEAFPVGTVRVGGKGDTTVEGGWPRGEFMRLMELGRHTERSQAGPLCGWLGYLPTNPLLPTAESWSRSPWFLLGAGNLKQEPQELALCLGTILIASAAKGRQEGPGMRGWESTLRRSRSFL